MLVHKPISRASLPGILLVVALLAAACIPVPGQPGQTAATATPLPAPENPTPTPWPPAQSAIQALARQLGSDPSQVKLVSSEPVDWPDGCLGVSQPDVMCTQVIVPGYRIILEANGQQFEVRTDRTGAAVVLVPAEQAGPADPPAVLAVRQAMAAQLGLELELVKALAVEPMTWSDACLGLGQPNESCALALTPGYRIVIEANGVRYVFHTDETGEQMRAAPEEEQPAVVMLLRDLIAGQLGIGADAVQVISTEAVEWPDACLGIQAPDLVCAQVVTPGYRVVLEAEGRRYTYHTDATGDSIMLAEEATAGPATPAVIEWQGQGPMGCTEAHITAEAVTFGACGKEAATGALLAQNDRPAQLADLGGAYASFAANTPAGRVTFTGQGAVEPAPAEQRMIAHWAAGVVEEARLGKSSIPSTVVLHWQRTGGVAGFCDDLTITLNGLAYGATCQGKALGDGRPQRLTAEELAALYDWVDALGTFEFTQQDAATADAMTISVAFTGAGSTAPGDAEKQAIAAFGAQVMARWAQ